MVKYCPACGEELVDNANFCKNCGANLNSSAPRAKVPERPVSEKSYTVHIIIAYILALLIPLFGLVMGAYLLTRNDSDDAKAWEICHNRFCRNNVFIIHQRI